jgi:tRNA 2-selenouridine synthase
LLDVRAPVEFAKGHMPGSTNLPILSDDERHKVGIAYKREGNQAATQLGEKLVSGSIRRQRIDAWLNFFRENPQAQVVCWRGGQRSKIAQTWLHESGCDIPQVSGGFKALRTMTLMLLDVAQADPRPWWIVSGRTGTQKTLVINALGNSIDLEGTANHRGSAFGAFPTPQPSPVTFEMSLAGSYARLASPVVVLEDESRTIGRLALPECWHARMQKAPIALIIDDDIEQRVAHIEREYVREPLDQGVTPQDLEEQYGSALGRISRRLGGTRHRELSAQLHAAFANRASHQAWIQTLLSEYYDPMYDYQLTKKQARIAFRGHRDEVREFLETVS